MPILHLPEDDLESKLNSSALWAVTYGDMMSYLMIFFLVLFAFNVTKKVDQKEVQPDKKTDDTVISIVNVFGGKIDLERQKRLKQRQAEQEMAQKAEAEAKAGPAGMEVKNLADRVQFVLDSAVLFDSGHAELRKEAVPTLEKIAENLKESPNEIVVEGHTDNVPIHHGKYSSNYELSMARAYSVVTFLINHGIAPQRLSGAGYGEYKPVADNQTAEGKAKNRRIEIALFRTK
ncbi:MAG: OmpA family protein [Elusimicrobia bacterium]|nr:OmpA family protein [Elusimicrobiota bacterium]